ncbi:PREDICTED: uncharacterized protein LOC103599693 [Galeopterus variegatus]|uniref:Uncharacterized protein LOC103599693 n=1 Tax=Galeopterus variegatus TaxID=482537 RepID=A0ABM0RN68_GALVR|nr:PREDICTED: uncharacterized protein LOC103599693 [Galeopterus variegatus]
MAGLRGAAKCPTNLTKVREITQGSDESPSAFLERLMEAFRRFTPYDPGSEKHKATVTVAFIDQFSRDIRKKLQKLEGLQDKSLRELVQVAEKVYHNRESEEAKEIKREKRQEKNFHRLLATVVRETREPNNMVPSNKKGPLAKDQCACCRERGHWVRNCPKKKKEPQAPKVSTLQEDSDYGRQGLGPLPEPRVTLEVEGKPIQFVVDTGAENSVLLQAKGPLLKKKSWVQGATGYKQYSWTTRRTVDLGVGRVSHSFIVIPECPYPLLGRDLLTKMGAQIHFDPKGPRVLDQQGKPLQVLTLRLEYEYQLFEKCGQQTGQMDWCLENYPQAWAKTAGIGKAKNLPPIHVELKAQASPIAVHQYPMTREAHEGIQPHIAHLLQLGILRKCQSAWNSPLLPVQKPGTNDYRPVQDL